VHSSSKILFNPVRAFEQSAEIDSRGTKLCCVKKVASDSEFGTADSRISQGLSGPQASMAVDMFLKVSGVAGESKDKVHTEEIDVLSWSWGKGSSPGRR
jgi:hypothetical protein